MIFSSGNLPPANVSPKEMSRAQLEMTVAFADEMLSAYRNCAQKRDERSAELLRVSMATYATLRRDPEATVCDVLTSVGKRNHPYDPKETV